MEDTQTFSDKLLFSARQIRQKWRARRAKKYAEQLPLKGHSHRHKIPFVDSLSDGQLTQLNEALDWKSFIVDSQGRRFGSIAWEGKRDKPARFPNKRALLFNEAFQIAGRTVLEVGCFEGEHTLGLCKLGAKVTAIDSRVENVIHSIVRTAFFDYRPRIFVCDIEKRPLPVDLLRAEFCHHIGVLYHLKDPVRHLLDLGEWITNGILLDTHFAEENLATSSYVVENESFAYQHYNEFGVADAFSGMYDHAKWLPLDSLIALLKRGGFSEIVKIETRKSRQGARALILARKNQPA